MIEKNRRNCAPSFSVRILVESLKEPTQRELAFFARRRELGLGVGLERREDGGIEMVPNPEERDDLAGAAIRGFCGLANVWNLSEIERASLLGLQEPEAYREIIAGHSVFTDEMMERVGHCLSIFRLINTLLPKPSSADSWIKRPNTHPMFGGEPALKLMMSPEVAGLKKVRRYLEAECH